ncbi:hypothetical protein LNQ03_08830 [Klebsiella pneumoniae subsp. pneumoniae]|nr:hypothetical protein [Klebsiella pneumoniae subsp. pneumoniae]
MGFCFLANIPIAVERAKAQLGLGKVAIIDWDVHHGNGTQHIYLQRDDVLTHLLASGRLLPAGLRRRGRSRRGRGRRLQHQYSAVGRGGDDSWRYALETIVIPALARFEPELIIIACGYDANAMDPLARMQLHSDSFRAMTEQVQQAADRPVRRETGDGARGRLRRVLRAVLRPGGDGSPERHPHRGPGSAAGIYSTAAAARHVRAVPAPGHRSAGAAVWPAIVAHAHVDP